jgi:hypothetical protein
VSPVATDKEGHNIKMTFSGLEGLVWATTRANDDGSFTFKAEKSLVTSEDVGEYSLTVSLGDEMNESGTKHTISVILNVTQLEQEEPKITGDFKGTDSDSNSSMMIDPDKVG